MLIAKRKCLQSILSTLLLSLMASFSAFAEQAVNVTVEDLLKSGDLKASVSIGKQKQLVPRQQVIFEIKVTSSNDYTDNTKVAVFDVKDAIVAKPFAKTGFNIETIEGKDWFVQTKETAMYPLYDGVYKISPITLEVFININGKVVSGKFKTEPYEFNIPKSQELKGKGSYIAGSSVEIVRTTIEQPEQALEVGSAVTIKRSLSGNELHAVMLPEIQPLQFEGAQVYEKPSTKSDNFDVMEGVSQGLLSSETTLIFQEEGVFKIPAKTFNWWDTAENKLKTITIEEMSFQVGDSSTEYIANAPQKPGTASLGSSSNFNWWIIIIIAAIVMFGIAIGKVIAKNKAAFTARFTEKSKFKSLVNGYKKAINASEYELALSYLYKIADIKNKNRQALNDLVTDSSAQNTVKTLFVLAYQNSNSESSISAKEANHLLDVILNNKHRVNFFTPVKFDLDLN